jgi:hypothetical protein
MARRPTHRLNILQDYRRPELLSAGHISLLEPRASVWRLRAQHRTFKSHRYTPEYGGHIDGESSATIQAIEGQNYMGPLHLAHSTAKSEPYIPYRRKCFHSQQVRRCVEDDPAPTHAPDRLCSMMSKRTPAIRSKPLTSCVDTTLAQRRRRKSKSG